MELEYDMFRNAKAANLYKASVLKKVGPRRGVGACSQGGKAAHPQSPTALPPAQAAQSPSLTQETTHLRGAHLPSFASWRYF